MNNLQLMNKRMNHARTMRAMSAVPANSSTSGLVRITNRRLQNYIEEKGILPVVEDDKVSYYRRTPQLFSLLESFDIEFAVMPNKL